MCGNSSRLSAGGTIAVLRPPPHESQSAAANCTLFFDNSKDRAGRTRAVFQTQGGGGGFDNYMGYFMLIHRNGDLLSRPPLSEEARNALYAIQLKPAVDEHHSLAQLDLADRLEFAVGGNGVIGRKVSIVTDLSDRGTTLAEGIIGWN